MQALTTYLSRVGPTAQSLRFEDGTVLNTMLWPNAMVKLPASHPTTQALLEQKYIQFVGDPPLPKSSPPPPRALKIVTPTEEDE